MYKHVLTDAGLEQFNKDYAETLWIAGIVKLNWSGVVIAMYLMKKVSTQWRLTLVVLRVIPLFWSTSLKKWHNFVWPMRILRHPVNPPRGTVNRAARLRLAFFFRCRAELTCGENGYRFHLAALLRIIINKHRSLRSLGGCEGGARPKAERLRLVRLRQLRLARHLLRF